LIAGVVLVLIYRVETESGDGLYRLKEGMTCPFIEIINEYTPSITDAVLIGIHIHPGQDRDLNWDQKMFREQQLYSFGFPSIAALRKWIYDDKWIIPLDERGYKISVYEVSDFYAQSSDRQSIFRKKHAKLIKVISFLDIV